MFIIKKSCMQCKIESKKEIEEQIFEINDSFIYTLKCENGHTTNLHLQNPRYDILFEIGVQAISDGYYREAISSFTSALERYYEFIIGFIFYEKREYEKFKQIWKNISRQSERQLGSFIVLYSFVLGKEPVLLSNKKIELRNSVIHKGKIPTKTEAIEYGKDIIEIIFQNFNLLKGEIEGFETKILTYIASLIDNLNNKTDCNEYNVLKIITVLSDIYDKSKDEMIMRYEKFCANKEDRLTLEMGTYNAI